VKIDFPNLAKIIKNRFGGLLDVIFGVIFGQRFFEVDLGSIFDGFWMFWRSIWEQFWMIF